LLLVQRIILDASIARAMSSSIHPFYRIWFTTIDPVLSLSGAVCNLFAPAAILRSYSPSLVFPPATETTVLLYTAAGFLAGHMLLSIGLLRAKPNDVTVWRAFQANSSIVDFFMIAGLAQAASVQGRLNLRTWRAEDWINVCVLFGVAIIRLAFLAGMGMSKRGREKGA
jgi:hypothetical protein